MYYCNLKLYFISNQLNILDNLKKISPPEHFSYKFAVSGIPDKSLIAESDVIFADIGDKNTKISLDSIISCKKSDAELIVLADRSQIEELGDIMPEITDIWTLPMSDTELSFRYKRWQRLYKANVDHWQTEHFLESTINSVPNLIWYKDKNGIHEKVNDSFCKVVGKTKAQVQGRGHAYIWNVEQDDPVCIESERIVMEKKKTCVSEETIQTGDGIKLLTTYKSPLYDWDGSVMGTVGVAIDVTREHAYANELIKKNQTLETLFTTMDCGVMCHSVDGSQIISINRAALHILGYDSQEELIKDGFNMIATSVLDEDKDKVRGKIGSLKKVGDNVSVEYRVIHKDGTILHVMGNVKLMEENGEQFYQRYLLDCTAQKLREEHKRKEDEQRQMELIHALSIEYNLVCYFDLDTGEGRALRIDTNEDNLRAIFSGKLSLEKCMKQYIAIRVHKDDRENLHKAVSLNQLEKELSEKKLFSINFRTDAFGEIHYFQLKAVRAGEWNNNRGVVLGICSVDDEIRSEMEKRAVLEDALVQANQANKAKTTFLSNMSHDIRTPMNAIIGFTMLALENIGNKELVQGYLNKIETSGKHLLSLINDVLDMSHIESGKICLDEKPCNISDILRELHNIIQADADKKRLDLYIDSVDIRHDEIRCDTLRLNQILLNLLNNAVKYTNPGGMISLKVIEKEGISEDFSNYEFHVRDTGIGMSEEFVKHIFEPFERELNSTVSGIRGTGLGMAITKNIVDIMHGTIEVRSRQGIGTECIVSLTLRLNSESNVNKKTVNNVSKTDIPIRNGRILLVEDNELNREIALTILEDAGFTVDFAENGQSAVDMLRNSEPGYYRLILMDIQMPVMNGYEATTIIRELNNKDLASVPIIAMTANAFEEDKQKALRCGMNAHIAKPIDVEKLLNTLDEIFSQYYSS